MTWNHRVLAHNTPSSDDIELSLHEVYYDSDNNPETYTLHPVGISGDSLEDLQWALDKARECLGEPILWAGDRWPEVYVPK